MESKNQKQSYNNHVRWYPPHHFIFYPLMSALIVFLAIRAYNNVEQREIYLVLIALAVMLTASSFMTRQHYALTLQNRIIKLEFQVRIQNLVDAEAKNSLEKLKDSQIFALRFAPDSELKSLIEKTIENNWEAKEIKKNIGVWCGDYDRV